MKSKDVLLITGVGLLLGLCTSAYPLNAVDGPIFSCVGRAIRLGGAPYRQVWDIKGPAIFFFYALASGLGKEPFSVHALEALWQCATALVLGCLAARIYSRRLAGVLAGITYLLFFSFQYDAAFGQPDGLLSLPLALAVWFGLSAYEGGLLSDWMLAGALVGLAALFKTPAAILGIALLGMAVGGGSRSLPRVSRSLAGLAAGFLLPWLLCAAYFEYHGALREFLWTIFVVGPKYSAFVWRHLDAGFTVRSLGEPPHIPLYFLMILGILSLRNLFPRRDHASAGAYLAAAWALSAMVMFVMQGGFFFYQFAPLYAPFALLGSATLERSIGQIRGRRRAGVAVLALSATAALAMLGSIVYFSSVSLELRREGRTPDRLRGLADVLRARTAAGDSIYVWGRDAQVYLDAHRRPSSRFINATVVAGPWSELGLREMFLQDLRTDPPAFFAVVRPSPQDPHELPEVRLRNFDADLENFPALQQFLNENFSVDSKNDLWILYRRNATPASPEGPFQNQGAPASRLREF